MDRQFVIDYLETIKKQVEKDHEELIAQVMMKRLLDKQDREYRFNVVSKKIRDIEFMQRRIIELNFTTEMTPEIEDCLSPFGTFCDRENFYYKEEFFNDFFDFTLEQKVQIIVAEICNSMQDYFMDKNADNTSETRRNITLLMLSHIGVAEKLPYALSMRNKLCNYFEMIYPDSKTISFGPNDNAAAYLVRKFLVDDKIKLGHIKDNSLVVKHNKDFVQVKASIYPMYYHVNESSGYCLLNREVKQYGMFGPKNINRKFKIGA
jgi:hypothetical protein